MLKQPDIRENPVIHLDIKENMSLGRIAAQIALVLRGKHKPTYTPHLLCGDKVLVTNVEKLHCSNSDKVYYRHSGHPGGLKAKNYADAKEDPCFPLFMAVKRMLNKSKLRKLMLRNLYLSAKDDRSSVNGRQIKTIEVSSVEARRRLNYNPL